MTPTPEQIEPYKIGDIVPYTNTHGNICEAEISALRDFPGPKTWFAGHDTKTNAAVWYPVRGSLAIRKYVESKIAERHLSPSLTSNPALPIEDKRPAFPESVSDEVFKEASASAYLSPEVVYDEGTSSAYIQGFCVAHARFSAPQLPGSDTGEKPVADDGSEAYEKWLDKPGIGDKPEPTVELKNGLHVHVSGPDLNSAIAESGDKPEPEADEQGEMISEIGTLYTEYGFGDQEWDDFVEKIAKKYTISRIHPAPEPETGDNQEVRAKSRRLDREEYAKWIKNTIEDELADRDNASLAYRLAFEFDAHVSCVYEGAEQWERKCADLQAEISSIKDQLLAGEHVVSLLREQIADKDSEIESLKKECTGLQNVMAAILPDVDGLKEILDEKTFEIELLRKNGASFRLATSILSILQWAAKFNLRRDMGKWRLDGHAFAYGNERIVEMFLEAHPGRTPHQDEDVFEARVIAFDMWRQGNDYGDESPRQLYKRFLIGLAEKNLNHEA